MDVQQINKLVMENTMLIVGILGILIIIMYAIIINLFMNLRYLKKRYRKMMTGVESGNLERMLIGHIDTVHRVQEENAAIRAEAQRQDALLQQAITRVGVVRFRAFDDMGSDLSYAVALLDQHNNGVILSSIFGREDSRSYVKPIKDGQSQYMLTDEEKQALADAEQQ